jgi:hypothetical protein
MESRSSCTPTDQIHGHTRGNFDNDFISGLSQLKFSDEYISVYTLIFVMLHLYFKYGNLYCTYLNVWRRKKKHNKGYHCVWNNLFMPHPNIAEILLKLALNTNQSINVWNKRIIDLSGVIFFVYSIISSRTQVMILMSLLLDTFINLYAFFLSSPLCIYYTKDVRLFVQNINTCWIDS